MSDTERDGPTVHTEDYAGGVRMLVLDRPPANAIDETLLVDLGAALRDARTDDAVRAVVLTGEGRFFGAGFDLFAPRRDLSATVKLGELYRDTHLELLSISKPTVALMNGHAIAGGLVMVLACDHRIALRGDYRVGLNEVAIGASFPRIAFEIVRLRLEDAHATELLLGAGIYPADDAERLGIIGEWVEAAHARSAAVQRAAHLGTFPSDAYAHTKSALLAEVVERVRAETTDQAEHAASVWMTAESRAARSRQRSELRLD